MGTPIGEFPPSPLDAAMEKHGSASLAVLSENWESWPINLSMRLIAQMSRDMARQLIRLEKLEQQN